MNTPTTLELRNHLLELMRRARVEDGRVAVRIEHASNQKLWLDGVSVRRGNIVLLEFREAPNDLMSRAEVTADPAMGNSVSLVPRGCTGRAVDGKWIEVRFASKSELEKSVSSHEQQLMSAAVSGEEGSDSSSLRDRMAEVFEQGDKGAALSLVQAHGAEAVAEVLVSNRFGPELFEKEEVFDLCEKYPFQNGLASLFNGFGWLEGGNMKMAIRHLEHAAGEGSVEAKGTLARIYIEGDGVKRDVVKGLVWLSQVGFGKEDPADDWFFGDGQFEDLPFNMSRQRWDWERLCELLNGLPTKSEAKKALAAVPDLGRIERRWVVVGEDED